MMPAGTPDEEVQRMALEDKKIGESIGGKEIKKVIVVRGKLVNIVIGN
jgi:leucyl-tRNA synthetase